MRIETAFRMRHTFIFLGTEVRLTGSYFPGSFFLLLLKTGVTFDFFQSAGTTSDHHDLSKIIVSSLSTIPIRQLKMLEAAWIIKIVVKIVQV